MPLFCLIYAAAERELRVVRVAEGDRENITEMTLGFAHYGLKLLLQV